MLKLNYGFSAVYHWSICLLLLPVPYHIDLYGFVAQFEIWRCDISGFVLSSQCGFGYLASSVISHKFQNCFFYLCEECLWYFDANCIESIDDFGSMTILWLVAQLCPVLCDPMDFSPPSSPVHGDSLGKNTGVGCHVFLQGIFPTQRSNPSLQHCRWIL